MKAVNRTAPHIGVNEGDAKLLDVGPKFSRKQPIQHVWGLVVPAGGVTEGLMPNITLIVFWPTQG